MAAVTEQEDGASDAGQNESAGTLGHSRDGCHFPAGCVIGLVRCTGDRGRDQPGAGAIEILRIARCRQPGAQGRVGPADACRHRRRARPARRPHAARSISRACVRYPVYSNIGMLDLAGRRFAMPTRVVAHSKPGTVPISAGGRRAPARDGPGPQRAVVGRMAIPFAQPIIEGDKLVAMAFASLDLVAASELARLDLPPGATVGWRTCAAGIVQHPRGTAVSPAGRRPASSRPAMSANCPMPRGRGDFGYATSWQISGEGVARRDDGPREARRPFGQAARRTAGPAVNPAVGVGLAWWIGRR